MDERLHESEEALIEALGRQSAFWGLGRVAGEMYAALYFSPGPLSLEELAARLGVTKGNISVAIRQLEHLNMVRRSQRRGDRRVFFEPETDFLKIARSVLSLRHKPEFEESFALVDKSARLAAAAPESPDRETAVQRLQTLQQFYNRLDRIVAMLLVMDPEQLGQLLEAFGSAQGPLRS